MIAKTIGIFGDSILKGIQVNPADKKYHVDNHIDIGMISDKCQLTINNFSRFGYTITHGYELLAKFISSGSITESVVMDYGGNDCDFNWKAIAENPDAEHLPNTPIDVFAETYRKIIALLRENCIQPIMTNLPPLCASKFLDWVSAGINKSNIQKWLGDVFTIYRFQENYSHTIEKIAAEESVPVVDLRGAFLKNKQIDPYLCEDGAHPNTEGQKLITQAFLEFIDSWRSRGGIAGMSAL